MREKLRELRNKEEGFTLVELLAVIVILGIIVAIAIPAIGNVINTAEEGATEAEKELVVDAARMYVTLDKNGQVPENGLSVTVETLQDAGYLEDDVAVTGAITVSKDGKKVTYETDGLTSNLKKEKE